MFIPATNIFPHQFIIPSQLISDAVKWLDLGSPRKCLHQDMNTVLLGFKAYSIRGELS